MGLAWVVILVMSSGHLITIPLDGTGSRQDCEYTAKLIVKELNLPVKLATCGHKYPII